MKVLVVLVVGWDTTILLRVFNSRQKGVSVGWRCVGIAELLNVTQL